MYILGINSAYHEPAACLIHDGRIVAAAEEERFNRIRHGKVANLANPHELPVESIHFCLQRAGIRPAALDHVAFSFVPNLRLRHNLGIDSETTPGGAGTSEGEAKFYELLRTVPDRLRESLGAELRAEFHWLEHHACHAASSFFVSPFEDAAILSMDGIGETSSIWLGTGRGTKISVMKEIAYPNSLGLLWTKMSRFLGFGEYGQWKVMGLAGYGNPDRFYAALHEKVRFDRNGNFEVDPAFAQFRVDAYDGFERIFGTQRHSNEEIRARHRDAAASVQRLTTEVVLALASFLREKTGLARLCYAGGVALNCVTNGILVDNGPFEEVFIQPAANDAGTALGACFFVWNHMLGGVRPSEMHDAYLGPEFSEEAVGAAVRGEEAGTLIREDFERVAPEVARRIADGHIVAWFQGRMEFGPRALGNRSILADPRRADIVHLLNDKVKHREYFRPFAASVLAENASEWFKIGRPCPGDAFMLCARRIRDEQIGRIPAVTHVDETCRIQTVDREMNPRFHQLISEFEKTTGIPMVLNTSFNDNEPIICSPQDALATCRKAGIRFLVMGDRLFDLQLRSTEELAREGLIARLRKQVSSYLEVPVMQPFRCR